jgi:ribosomal protein S14
MIRTVSLVAVCLVVLGAVVVGKVAKTPVPKNDEAAVEGATVGADLIQEPLTKADRLEITYVREEGPTQQPIDQIIPEAQKAISPPETHIVSRHWHDSNALNSSAPKSRQTITVRKAKATADSRGGQVTDRSKPSEQVKRCDRTTAFTGLLRSLNLARACDS